MITLLIKNQKLLGLLLLAGIRVAGQAQAPLDTYVETGLKNNLVLQQKNISLEKALYDLKTANSLFLPSINLKGDYQSGQGGRSIALPLGDLMNPVYGTLNQLTASNAFPQINNAEVYFFPQNFYDVKARTSMPLINSDLVYNRNIQKQQVVLQEYDVEIYRQELSKNIRVAYYNYLGAAKSVQVYESALLLALEAKRINESLVSNGKSVKAYVLRSESEIENLGARKTTAQQQARNAQLYFNFLINAEAGQSIDTAGAALLNDEKIRQYLANEASTGNRTELKAVAQSALVYETMLKMNKGYWYPRLSAFLDLGSQASDWKFNNKTRYYFVGVQLDIPVFSGGKNVYKIKQSKLDLQNQQLNTQYINKQLAMAAGVSKNNLQSAYENYVSGKKQVEAAQAYQKLVDRGYQEGMNTFIETIDARNQFTAASLQFIISKYQLMGALATYEREISK